MSVTYFLSAFCIAICAMNLFLFFPSPPPDCLIMKNAFLSVSRNIIVIRLCLGLHYLWPYFIVWTKYLLDGSLGRRQEHFILYSAREKTYVGSLHPDTQSKKLISLLKRKIIYLQKIQFVFSNLDIGIALLTNARCPSSKSMCRTIFF